MVVNWHEMFSQMIDRMIVLRTHQTSDIIFGSSHTFSTFDATRSLITIPKEFAILFCNRKCISATTLRAVESARRIVQRLMLFYKILNIHLCSSLGVPLGKFLAFIISFKFRQPPKIKNPLPIKTDRGQGKSISTHKNLIDKVNLIHRSQVQLS